MPEAPYRRVHVIINPASGRDEPILNVLNDVFGQHEVDWDISVTHRYGDAAAQARQAVEDGVDLVAGYGGDGTQHEIANALVDAAVATGRRTPMGILPGGTGNGFAREMGVPGTLREATEVLCTSRETRAVDVGRLRDLGQADGRRPVLRPAAVRGGRARGADESRAQGQVRGVRVPGQRRRHHAARHDGRPLPRRAGRRVDRVRCHRRSTSSTPG